MRAFLAATGTLPQNINWAVKSAYAIPLFDLPAAQRRAGNRNQAIERAMNATCMVVAATPASVRTAVPKVSETPHSAGSVTTDVEFPNQYYLRQLQAKIRDQWTPPRRATAGGEKVVILFEIGRDGKIKGPVVERSSGNAIFDQSALRAVVEASPFLPLPSEYTRGSLRVHFTFSEDGE